MAVAKRAEGANINSNINVTPMVDVMLVLLIIFMVITPMLQNKVQIDMAKVENPETMQDADKEDAIVVAVTRDGKTYLGQDQVNVSLLGDKVQEALTKNKVADASSKTIYVRADSRAQFIKVENAIDAIRTVGIQNVGLLTQKRGGDSGGGAE